MAAKVNIRRCSEADWPAVWDIMEPVIRVGDTYPYAMDMTVDGARQMWLEIPAATYVAEDTESNILGTYYLKPNQPTLGAHVANCGYMVAERARGMGIATQMCEHSQDEAIRMGYRAMQYNLVVKTNEASVHLWQKMGFAIVGTLPGASKHSGHNFVDAYVMYKELIT
ncbi:MAG: GNAT family N-acetyltransferase [Gammaproteobacteria bacterium]|nr:MAG: GNAT family N-acetyltransferase [Gammaproteobacteria bacterium]